MPKDFLSENDDRFYKFREHYSELFFKVLHATESSRIDLGYGADKTERKRCRYCRKVEGDTTFRKESHAIPITLGNRTLIDSLECDECNNHFSVYLEDSFSKFILPHKIINTIRGRGNPKYSDEDVEIAVRGKGDININVLAGSKVGWGFETLENGHRLKLDFTRQSYRPIAVYKMFVKIALALMPDAEMSKLDLLRQWILSKEHIGYFSGVPVTQWEFQGNFDPCELKCGLFKVKDEFKDDYFTYTLVLVFGNLQYCVVVPDPALDRNVRKTMLNFPVLIDARTVENCGVPSFKRLYFDSGEVVRKEKISLFMTFKDVVKTNS